MSLVPVMLLPCPRPSAPSSQQQLCPLVVPTPNPIQSCRQLPRQLYGAKPTCGQPPWSYSGYFPSHQPHVLTSSKLHCTTPHHRWLVPIPQREGSLPVSLEQHFPGLSWIFQHYSDLSSEVQTPAQRGSVLFYYFPFLGALPQHFK